MIDKAPKGPRGVIFSYTALNAQPYLQQVQPAQEPYQSFTQSRRIDQPRYPKVEPQKFSLLPMPMVEFHTHLLEKKLVTQIFAKLKDSPPLPNFDPS